MLSKTKWMQKVLTVQVRAHADAFVQMKSSVLERPFPT